jgi:hypothetical protein
MKLPNNPNLAYLVDLTEDQIKELSAYDLERYEKLCGNELKELQFNISVDNEGIVGLNISGFMDKLSEKKSFANNLLKSDGK